MDPDYCSEKGVNVVITDQGSSDRTDFILSRRAFGRMAHTQDAASSLLSLGTIDIEYRRYTCNLLFFFFIQDLIKNIEIEYHRDFM